MSGINKSLSARFATWIAVKTGSTAAFMLALSVIVVWAVTGPIFRFSDTWQLVINTGTTVVTFLMVILIQHAQNRESLALQLKLTSRRSKAPATGWCRSRTSRTKISRCCTCTIASWR